MVGVFSTLLRNGMSFAVPGVVLMVDDEVELQHSALSAARVG